MTTTFDRYKAYANYRRRKRDEMLSDTNHKHHGTTTGYQCGCRCEDCSKAMSDYQRSRNARKRAERNLPLVPMPCGDIATGMRRRYDDLFGLNQGWEI